MYMDDSALLATLFGNQAGFVQTAEALMTVLQYRLDLLV